ncbi:high-affinity choline transporter 1-like [Ornithodoros turicata]|uniref:high-affinity choline transporter 1-like n=1 Tax=Ornithodoros turicata TaxID=34597 RepID=UPI00313A4D30
MSSTRSQWAGTTFGCPITYGGNHYCHRHPAWQIPCFTLYFRTFRKVLAYLQTLVAMALDTTAALVVIFYYLLITAVGVWAARKLHVGSVQAASQKLGKAKYRKERRREEQLYLLRLFLCERKLTVCLGLMTMTATWVGGGYLSGVAEVVYSSGIIWCHAPLGYAISLLLGGRLFAQKIRSTDSITMLDPFQRRFGKWIVVLPIIPAICGEICWAAAILTALGTAVDVMIGFESSTIAIVISSFVTIFYTALGGLYSVVYTDFFQLLTSAVALWYCVPFVLRNDAVGTFKGPESNWVGNINFEDVPVALDFFLMTALGGISWQVYFQRVLSAETEVVARMISYLAAFGCIFLALPPAIIGAAATTTNFTKVGPGPARLAEEDQYRILPYAMHMLTPRYEAVLGMLAIVTAVMSSVDSSILSAATLTTRNVYQKLIRPKASTTEIGTFLRASVVGFGGLATILALSVKSGSVYSLWVLSSDLVYVLLFPQMVSIFYLQETTNSYGLLCGFLLGGTLRTVSGEPSVGVPVLLQYPFYDAVRGQQFPFRTLCMGVNFGSLVLFSKLAAHLFKNNILAPNLDYFNSFPALHLPPEQPAAGKPSTEQEESKPTAEKADTEATLSLRQKSDTSATATNN